MVVQRKRRQVVFSPDQELYQARTVDEDRERTNSHYEQPVEFFLTMTGGEWNVYSANLWDAHISTVTESQEAKLDLIAEAMQLKPGQRIMDVGCGWGGPLVYLCRKYGVRGVGLTLSAVQQRAAAERAARYGVDVEIVQSHWADFQDEQGFDAVYTDEVIVHFYQLGDFFSKVHSVLRDGGRMVNKELHLTHPRYGQMTRGMSFINEIFGSTGNYRTLSDELALANGAGFEVRSIRQMPLLHYQRTVRGWLANLREHRDRLEELVTAETYRRFRTYLKLCDYIHGGRTMTVDIVACDKLPR